MPSSRGVSDIKHAARTILTSAASMTANDTTSSNKTVSYLPFRGTRYSILSSSILATGFSFAEAELREHGGENILRIDAARDGSERVERVAQIESRQLG